MEVCIINRSHHPLPTYATLCASGMDLHAFIKEPIILAPFERKLIGTGIFISLPKGYEAQVRPRSGFALKYGISVLNSPGTIDQDYRGEIKVMIINLSNEKFILENGDRIAQLVVSKYESIKWKEVSILDETTRGESGFGSTDEL